MLMFLQYVDGLISNASIFFLKTMKYFISCTSEDIHNGCFVVKFRINEFY